MITVKVCPECNREKSECDTYLRDYLIMDAESGPTPQARELLFGPVWRAMARNQSIMVKSAGQATRQPQFSRAGIYLGKPLMADVDVERLVTSIFFIVLGLYYHAEGKRLPDGYGIRVARAAWPDAIDVVREESRKPHRGPIYLGDNVFWFLSRHDEDDPGETRWLLCFYDRVLFLAETSPPDQEE